MIRRNHLSGRMKALTVVLVSLILTSSMAMVASAQKRNAGTFPSSASRRRNLPGREAEVSSRELGMRLMREQPKAKKPNDHDRKLILSQIFEDFEHIQLLNNETRAASTSQALAYGRISDVAEEISRRAKRLKTNLGVPHFEEAGKGQLQQVATNGEQLRASLLTLNQLVKSLVTNPFFQNPKVTVSREFAMVAHDLAGIVELSHGIKKSAEKLKK